MSKRVCEECCQLILGRRDKKFCSKSCSNHYHNRIRGLSNRVQETNKILKKNHKILMEYSSNGGGIITHAALKERGFDFNHFTSHLPLKTDKGIGRMVYDQCYVFFPEGLVRIHRNSNLIY